LHLRGGARGASVDLTPPLSSPQMTVLDHPESRDDGLVGAQRLPEHRSEGRCPKAHRDIQLGDAGRKIYCEL